LKKPEIAEAVAELQKEPFEGTLGWGGRPYRASSASDGVPSLARSRGIAFQAVHEHCDAQVHHRLDQICNVSGMAFFNL
jgi:hypothetical protein